MLSTIFQNVFVYVLLLLVVKSEEESMGEEEEAKEFDYLLVQKSQLEAILSHRCVRCGKAKYERSTPSKRPRLSDHAKTIMGFFLRMT